MAVQLKQKWVSLEEYFEMEEAAEERSEYFSGRVFAMAGASPDHSFITINVGSELRSLLKGSPCRVFGTDLRINVSETGLYTYADAGVVCGEPLLDPNQKRAILNPKVIIEVLSPSTESYDRAAKFDHYSTIDSFTDYLLVSQNKPRVEHYRRERSEDEWILRVAHGPDSSVKIESIGIEVRLSEVYAGIKFSDSDEHALRPSTPDSLETEAD